MVRAGFYLSGRVRGEGESPQARMLRSGDVLAVGGAMFHRGVKKSVNATRESARFPAVPARRYSSAVSVDHPPGLLRALTAARAAAASPGAGEPLPQPDREAMSARFGYDF